MSVIYQPAGRAREYADWACNLYRGCSHGCTYCYAPAVLRSTKDEFLKSKPRLNILEELTKDVKNLKTPTEIHLCFTCDPYQPEEETALITRQALGIIKGGGHSVRILTKAGILAQRDFMFLNSKDWFGVTLTCDNPEDSAKWEPKAANPHDRIMNLVAAKSAGLKTWVSLEPVLYHEQTFNLIRRTAKFVDLYKVGTLNHHAHAKTINWPKFAREVKSLLESLRLNFYLKQDLRKFLA